MGTKERLVMEILERNPSAARLAQAFSEKNSRTTFSTCAGRADQGKKAGALLGTNVPWLKRPTSDANTLRHGDPHGQWASPCTRPPLQTSPGLDPPPSPALSP